jgi:hypothetical protein
VDVLGRTGVLLGDRLGRYLFFLRLMLTEKLLMVCAHLLITPVLMLIFVAAALIVASK